MLDQIWGMALQELWEAEILNCICLFLVLHIIIGPKKNLPLMIPIDISILSDSP